MENGMHVNGQGFNFNGLSNEAIVTEVLKSILNSNPSIVQGLFTNQVENPIALNGNQRYNPSQSFEIVDLARKDWEEMKKVQWHEHKAYWNEERKKWCIALSLGYKENGKRNRKVITADTMEILYQKLLEFQTCGMVIPADRITTFDDDTAAAPVPVNVLMYPKSEMLLKDYITEYLGTRKGDMEDKTLDVYKNAAVHISNGLGHLKINEINKTVLQTFFNQYASTQHKRYENSKPKYYSQSQIDKTYNLLNMALREAADEDGTQAIRINFMDKVKKPKSKKISEHKRYSITNDEVKEIEKAIRLNRMIHCWILILLFTGCRPSEGLALRFSNINYANKTIDILYTVGEDRIVENGKKVKQAKIKEIKNGVARTLKVDDTLLNIIKNWEEVVKNDSQLMKLKQANGTTDYLFCKEDGTLQIYDEYLKGYERVMKLNGVDPRIFNTYRFRHNCCIRLLRQGTDIKTVQMILGDKTPHMVLKHYANMDKEDVYKGCEKYSEALTLALNGEVANEWQTVV